jgi:glucose-6-phosphate isomerase
MKNHFSLPYFKYEDDSSFMEISARSFSESESYKSVKERANNIFADLKKTDAATKFYKILHNHDCEKMVGPLIEKANFIKDNFTDLVIVAMGGAITNPRSLISSSLQISKIRIRFLDTTDSVVFHSFITSLDLRNTAILVISNSGETLETISLFGAILSCYRERNISNLHKYFYFIVCDTDNYLNNKAKNLGLDVIEYGAGLSGRYATISNSTIFPGLVAGVDIEAFIAGANYVLEDFWKNGTESISFKAALTIFIAKQPIMVNLAYNNKMDCFLDWYSQIIAESLGKQKLGFTPLKSLGPIDQHSMLQLYLDGPCDKIFTLIYSEDYEVNNYFIDLDDYSFINKKTLKQVHKSLFDATVHSLTVNKLPVRFISLNKIDEGSMGALMMHSAIEIIICSLLIGINPFDQPAVEQIKTKAKSILTDTCEQF